MDWSKWRRLLRGSSGNVETPQGTEEAQGRPVESEAICGKEQRHLTKQQMFFALKRPYNFTYF
ncbi:hypothetical protein AAV98_17915 [Bacillus sp. CHD6a]|nr:hypothetical protein AAV98_17915 [Bacillus sp. CHD6a]